MVHIQSYTSCENGDLLPKSDNVLCILGSGEDIPWWVGGEFEQKKGITYAIQRPGTDSHAHCSVDVHKAIYTLKLTLLLHCSMEQKEEARGDVPLHHLVHL